MMLSHNTLYNNYGMFLFESRLNTSATIVKDEFRVKVTNKDAAVMKLISDNVNSSFYYDNTGLLVYVRVENDAVKLYIPINGDIIKTAAGLFKIGNSKLIQVDGPMHSTKAKLYPEDIFNDLKYKLESSSKTLTIPEDIMALAEV